MIKDYIDEFMKLFTKITKEESDGLELILRWDDEKRCAFFFAKKLFEEEKNQIDEIADQIIEKLKEDEKNDKTL